VPRASVLPDLSTPEGAASQGTDFDLGVPSQVTTLRPFLTPPRPITPADVAPPPEAPRPGWKDPRLITLVAACLVLIVGAGLFVTLKPGGSGGEANAAGDTPGEAAGPVSVQGQEAQPTLAGLSVERAATYDPAEKTIELSTTYGAAKAPLTGPFLEVIPGASETECPFDVDWPADGTTTAERNLSDTTGIVAPCGWAVDVGTVEPDQRVTATATISHELEGDDLEASLQTWLDEGVQGLTDEALAKVQTGTSYPVQRLTGIEVVAPSRVPASNSVQLKLQPVWSGGDPDNENVLYRSPDDGAQQSQVLTQLAGPNAVRLTDLCNGNLAVVDQGTTVVARNFSESCTIGARVGNVTDLESNEFAITTRGS